MPQDTDEEVSMPLAATFDRRDTAELPLVRDTKSERVVARATPTIKSLLERASVLEGRSLSDFLVQKGMEAAVRTIAEYETIVLTEHEREAFFNALLNPTEPSQKAMDAAKRYRENMQQSG